MAWGSAVAQVYVGLLDGAAEEPPNASLGVGSVRIALDTESASLALAVSFSGLSGGTTQAHIHCCVAPPGVAGFATQMPSLDRFPTAVTAGAHAQLLDLTATSSFDAAFIGAHGGTVASAAAALAAGLASGQAYLEIRTSAFAAGEVRGFLVLSDEVLRDGFETPARALSLLRCDGPADGALVGVVAGSDVAISGTALGLSNVRVNGQAVAVAPDRSFTSAVTGRYGLNFVELAGTDAAGMPRAGLCAFLGAERWVDEGAEYFDALRFFLEQPGLQKLSFVLDTYFAGADVSQRLDASLLAGNPLLAMSCGATGTCVREIRHLSVALLRNSFATVIPNAQTLRVALSLDIPLRERVRTQTSGAQSTRDGDVVFDNAQAVGSATLGIAPGTGLPQATAQGGYFVLGAVTSQFLGMDPQFTPTVEAECTSAVATRLITDTANGTAGLFAGLFDGMDVTLPAAGFLVARLDGSGSVTVTHARRASVAFTNQNELRLDSSLRIVAPPPPVGATGRFPVPPVPTGITRPGMDGWSAVSAGVFNQILQALWRAGLFDGVVDGAAIDPGLPAGTSLSLQLRTMPVVTGFAPDGTTRLEIGALDLVVTHPQLPQWLRVTAGARISARATMAGDDVAFSAIAVDTLLVATGDITLDAASQATLQDLLQALFVKLAGIALNDSLPAFPETRFTVLPSLAPYGLTVGSRLIGSPIFGSTTDHLFLEGAIGL